MKTVTAVLAAGSKTVEITGQHGTFAFKIENPVEIGLAVVEALTGHRICQPAPYRRATDPAQPPEFLDALKFNEAIKGDAP